MSHTLPVICICGPTASGKSAVGFALAERLQGEVISADAMAVYRGMDIGTAKPTAAEAGSTPVHLIDVVEPDEPFTVAEFQQRALQCVREIRRRGRQPIIVGGTGLYVRALLDGYVIPPTDPSGALRDSLRARLRKEGVARLHAELAQRDPEQAAHTHPNDAVRILRALEICLLTGRTCAEARHASPHPDVTPSVRIGLAIERETLYERIDRRVCQMVQAGWLDEVDRLLASGYNVNAPGMRSLGYREIVQVLQGELSVVEAIARIQQQTRRFAKRQLTWFRADPAVVWINAQAEPSTTAALVEALVQQAC